MAEETPPEDALTALRRRVAQARGDGASTSPPPQSPASLALRFGGEFGAAILVGALLGYGGDRFLHTSPVGMVVGIGLGFVAGVVNVVRVARSFNQASAAEPSSNPDGED